MSILRLKLEEMTRVQDISRHPTMLALLGNRCPHTIKIIASPHLVERYTCLMHTLDFARHEGYAAIAERGFNVVFAGRKFAHWLIDRNLLSEIPTTETQHGDFVFYFDHQGQFRHAGLMIGEGRVRSKWGRGHLFEHGLLELPESYGTTVRFFKKLPDGIAYSHFRNFAEEQGMLLEEV